MEKEQSRKPAVAAILATYVCAEASFVVAMISGPTFKRILNLTATQLGMCLGAAFLGNLLTSVFIGRATARCGAYQIASLGLSGLIASLGLIVLAGSFPPLYVGLVLLGASAATLHNALASVLSDICASNFRRIMALASAMWFGSSVVWSPLIGGWLSFAKARDVGRWSYGLPSLAAIILLAGCLFQVRRRLAFIKHHRAQASLDEATASSPRRGFAWLWIPLLALGHGIMAPTFAAWANPMLQASFGVDDFKGSLGFAVLAFGLSAGRFGLVARRVMRNDRMLLAVSGITGGAILALSLYVEVYGLALLLIGVGAFAASATLPCLFSIAAERFPRAKSRLFGYQEASIALGGLAGPFLVGMFVDLGAAPRTALLLAPLGGLLMGAGSLAWMVRDRKRGMK